jgi:hypothetical protein
MPEPSIRNAPVPPETERRVPPPRLRAALAAMSATSPAAVFSRAKSPERVWPYMERVMFVPATLK